MLKKYDDNLEFTNSAFESMYNAVDDRHFHEKDSELIYEQLENSLRAIPFCDYLKRYIYQKAEMTGGYEEIPLNDYRMILCDSFHDNATPPSFTPTSAKLSALSKNWLTQQTVKRNVVFLLGFGLGMSLEDVNEFLTKALMERGINPKDPFEVICWYCLKNGYGYPKFEQLWKIHCADAPDKFDMGTFYSDQTVGFRNTMYSINDDASLIAHTSKLKNSDNISRFSVTAKKRFDDLYLEARRIIAGLYNGVEEDTSNTNADRLSEDLEFNTRMYDFEKLQKVRKTREDHRVWTADDITENDIEQIIYSAVPKDRHGNLTPAKASKLNALFAGKRFSRQHINEILSGGCGVDRFDLITLNFFIYSQKADTIPLAARRYSKFVSSTNQILCDCEMGELYTANPYECFLMMCILSDDPLGTYADVWELSYEKQD